jgi:glucan-binding YG repeat protein
MPLPGKYYYLDESGVMLHDTVADGYQLGSDGLRGAAVQQTEASIEESIEESK